MTPSTLSLAHCPPAVRSGRSRATGRPAAGAIMNKASPARTRTRNRVEICAEPDRRDARAGGHRRRRPTAEAAAEPRMRLPAPKRRAAGARRFARRRPRRLRGSWRAATPKPRCGASGARSSACSSSRRAARRRDPATIVRGAADAARSNRGAPRRADARRLRRQRQPRIAHAARLAARLRRDAAGLGARRREARDEFLASCANRRGGWRGWSTISCRCRASSRISTCGRRRRSIWRGRPPCRRHAGAAGAGERASMLKVDVAGRVMVSGDRDELVRVAENLIENAIKYGAAGEWTPSRGRNRGHAARRARLLSVRDHGPRHRARTPAAADRTLLSHRCWPEPRRRAAPGLGSPSSNTSSRAIAAGWPSRASSAHGATFTVIAPLHRPSRRMKPSSVAGA